MGQLVEQLPYPPHESSAQREAAVQHRELSSMLRDTPERQDGERAVRQGGSRGRGYMYNSFTLFYSRK